MLVHKLAFRLCLSNLRVIPSQDHVRVPLSPGVVLSKQSLDTVMLEVPLLGDCPFGAVAAISILSRRELSL